MGLNSIPEGLRQLAGGFAAATPPVNGVPQIHEPGGFAARTLQPDQSKSYSMPANRHFNDMIDEAGAGTPAGMRMML